MMKSNSEATVLEAGQIRKLDGIQGIASARLVIIAETDTKDASCLVFLLNKVLKT